MNAANHKSITFENNQLFLDGFCDKQNLFICVSAPQIRFLSEPDLPGCHKMT